MESKKPNSFREAALSHIPKEVFEAMEKKATITPLDLAALESVVKSKGPQIQALVNGAKAPAQPAPQAVLAAPLSLSYAIEGHVINVPTDSVGAAIGLFYTLLTFVWSKDKKVAKILQQFDFKFYDANKQQVFPKVKRNGRK